LPSIVVVALGEPGTPVVCNVSEDIVIIGTKTRLAPNRIE
jgi:hypothetical protein